jgi:hypothetical protein
MLGGGVGGGGGLQVPSITGHLTPPPQPARISLTVDPAAALGGGGGISLARIHTATLGAAGCPHVDTNVRKSLFSYTFFINLF